jgi:hypothetical protein
MKAFKLSFALIACLFALPVLADNGDDKKGDDKKTAKSEKASTEMSNSEIRKMKKLFTKKVRSMNEAKNHPEGQTLVQGKFGAK